MSAQVGRPHTTEECAALRQVLGRRVGGWGRGGGVSDLPASRPLTIR